MLASRKKLVAPLSWHRSLLFCFKKEGIFVGGKMIYEDWFL
jgi:hypothetical protein